MPADPVPHPRTTAVWLTGCLRDAARPRDLNFGDLRHFETNIDPILEPNWPAKTIKDLERECFEPIKSKNMDIHPRLEGYLGSRMPLLDSAPVAPLFALGFSSELSESSRTNPWLVQNHGIQREPARFKCLEDPLGSGYTFATCGDLQAVIVIGHLHWAWGYIIILEDPAQL